MSTLPSDTPRLPKWPFLAGDAVLLGIAVLIAQRSPTPWPAHLVMVITVCVSLAAILGVIPFLTDYAGKQDEALDERQRSLEALTRTVAESAEQISIAANGLHELSELAQKQIREAEALPEKLLERFQNFNRQLSDAAVAENKTLQQELKSLRASEVEKITAAADRIHKTVSELTRLETATGKQLAAAQDALARLPEILAKARDEARQAITAAQQAALPKITGRTATEASPPPAIIEPVQPAPPPPELSEPPAPKPEPQVQRTVEPSEPAQQPEVKSEPEPTTPPTEDAPSEPEPASVEANPEPVRKSRAPRKPKAEESAELPLGHNPSESVDSEDTNESSAEDTATHRALSADGATRLLVTAYIGIGNRLFARGEGPGLSVGKGVPLQFVSIGKWRWETNEATSPLRLRIFKNDEVECSALGEVMLEPGQQTEVSARF